MAWLVFHLNEVNVWAVYGAATLEEALRFLAGENLCRTATMSADEVQCWRPGGIYPLDIPGRGFLLSGPVEYIRLCIFPLR